jgi:hypothetical protein
MTDKTVNTTTTADVPASDAKNVFKLVIEDRLAQLGVRELRDELAEIYGDGVWTSEELLAQYEVSHFDPPYVHVIRKSDGVRGTVAYTDEPRLYFSFIPLRKNE